MANVRKAKAKNLPPKKRHKLQKTAQFERDQNLIELANKAPNARIKGVRK